MHTGDRLVSLDGRAVKSWTDFRSWLGQLHVGQTARVEVMRAGAPAQIVVPIGGYDRPTVRVDEIADASPEQWRLREPWLIAEDVKH